MLNEKFLDDIIKEIQKVDNLVSLVHANRSEILKIYMNIQFEIFDVAEDLIQDFVNEMKEDMKDILKSSKAIREMITKNVFGYKQNTALLEFKKYEDREDYVKITELAEDLALNIGTDYFIEVIEELALIENKSLNGEEYSKEYFDFLVAAKNFITDLTDLLMKFSAQLGMLMEEYIVVEDEDIVTEDEEIELLLKKL